MDRELFYEIILFAENRGLKVHLGMLPVMPLNHTSAECLASKIFWQRRWEIIFSHRFAKAIWDDHIARTIEILLTEEIMGKSVKELFKKKMFIKKFGKKLYTKLDMRIPMYGGHLASISTLKLLKQDIISCLKNKYKCLISFGHDYDWEEHLQQMVLAKDPFKYLENEYKRSK